MEKEKHILVKAEELAKEKEQEIPSQDADEQSKLVILTNLNMAKNILFCEGHIFLLQLD